MHRPGTNNESIILLKMSTVPRLRKPPSYAYKPKRLGLEMPGDELPGNE